MDLINLCKRMDSKTETTCPYGNSLIERVNYQRSNLAKCNTYQYDKKSNRQYFRKTKPDAPDTSVLMPGIRVISRNECKEGLSQNKAQSEG